MNSLPKYVHKSCTNLQISNMHVGFFKIELCCNNLLNDVSIDPLSKEQTVEIDQTKKLIQLLGTVYDRIPCVNQDGILLKLLYEWIMVCFRCRRTFLNLFCWKIG